MKKALTICLTLTTVFLVISLVLVGTYYYKNIFPFRSVKIENTPAQSVEVEINTIVEVKAKIEYGTSQLYLNETQETSEATKTQTIEISGLLPAKEHFLRVVATDSGGRHYTSKFYSF